MVYLEIEARNARKGLWVDKHPMEPWRNRKLHRSGISTKDSFDIQPGRTNYLPVNIYVYVDEYCAFLAVSGSESPHN